MSWAENYTMKKLGTFSTPTFAGVGEPFVDTMQGARCYHDSYFGGG